MHAFPTQFGTGNKWHGESVRGVFGGSGYNSDFGMLVYYRYTTRRWIKADATAVGATSTSLLGICLTTNSVEGEAITVLLHGFYGTQDGEWTTSLTNEGEPLYIDTTAGYVTSTAPGSSGNVVRIIGHTYTVSDPWVVRFNPDNFWLVI